MPGYIPQVICSHVRSLGTHTARAEISRDKAFFIDKRFGEDILDVSAVACARYKDAILFVRGFAGLRVNVRSPARGGALSWINCLNL